MHEACTVPIPEPLRYVRTADAPVDIPAGDENSIDARVRDEVLSVDDTTWSAVVRICLKPFLPDHLMIDIIAVPLLLTSRQQRPLSKESFIGPILVEGESLRDQHAIYETPRAALCGRARGNDKVTWVRTLSDFGLAGCESTTPMERIRCETVITYHYVGE
jgi:hypothetical protein